MEVRYADCRIVWKDDRQQEDVRIMLSDGLDGDDVFYNCSSLNDLLSLTECGNADFVVTGCHGFAAMPKMKRLERQIFEYEVKGKTVPVTGKEVLTYLWRTC